MANRRPRSPSPPSTASLSRSPIAADPPPYFLPELIPEVARHLTSLQDFFALRAACRTYRALLPVTSSNLASQAPLLLVPSGDGTPCPALLHLPLHRIHRFRLPRTSRAGAEHVVTEFHPLGCRVAISNSYAISLPKHELSIIHLLTGERVCLPSPPGDFSHIISSGDLLVAWSYRDIFYYRFGTPEWRVAPTRHPNEFRDLILVKDTLYALTLDQRVAIVELPDNNNGLKLAILERGSKEHGHILLRSVERSKGFCVLQWQSGDRKWLQ
nr:unnamed protein product [Digitaria exilis]